MDELNFGFDHGSPKKAMEEFAGKLGQRNDWFIKFINCIMQMKNSQKSITDIVIRENYMIKVGAAKTFLPLAMHREANDIFVPTGNEIDLLTHTLLDTDTNYLKQMSSIDFSPAIYGTGIFRINYSRDIMGVALAIRYLDFDIPPFTDRHYPAYYKKQFQSLIITPNMHDNQGKEQHELGKIAGGGLILHVGPTGSGKTTAIASEIKYISDRISGNILMYENPVEYRFIQTPAIVRQYEIGKHIKPQGNFTLFETIKVHLVRSDPSVVMISEIRTSEEIDETIDISTRGHLTLGTMHSKTPVEALTQLTTVSERSRHKLSESLIAIVAHALHRTRDDKLIPIYEVLIPDKTVRQKIAEGKIQDIHRMFYQEKNTTSMKETSMTFKECISDLTGKGIITREDRQEIENSLRFTIN